MPATAATETPEVLHIHYAVEPPTLEQIVNLANGSRILGPTATMFMVQAATRLHYNSIFTERRPIAQIGQELGGLSVNKVHSTLRRLDNFNAVTLMPGNTIEINRWHHSD